MIPITKILKLPVDFIFTLLFWLYIIFGFLLFYIPVLITISLFIKNRETKFQKMNHYYYLGFFRGLNALVPGLTIKVSDDVKEIKSSMIISNHRSYLDPILLISIFQKHKTIVKGVFFKVPFINWAMKSGGYIPFTPATAYNDLISESIKNIPEFINDGGNVFIFPEGRRSRNGRLGKFQKGAFSIAKKYNMPVQVIFIKNTDRLFTPGKFLLNTCILNTITVEKLGTIEPSTATLLEMKKEAIMLYEKRLKKDYI